MRNDPGERGTSQCNLIAFGFFFVALLILPWQLYHTATSTVTTLNLFLTQSDVEGLSGDPNKIKYADWPPPQVELSRSTMAGIGFGVTNPPTLDANQVVQNLGRLAQQRGRNTPAVLVVAGGGMHTRLADSFVGLALAAVTAEAIGAACLVTLGATASPQLLDRVTVDRYFATPCQLVDAAELDVLRAQKDVVVVRQDRWRLGGFGNVTGNGTRPAGGAYILDFGTQHLELGCMARPDAAKLLVPPGMAPRDFWERLRRKFEEWVHVSVDLPLEAHDELIEGFLPPWEPNTGTICGHIGAPRQETGGSTSAASATCAAHCGGVLRAMEAIHGKRQFPTYFYTSDAECAGCLAERAPTLARMAQRIGADNVAGATPARKDVETLLFTQLRTLTRCALLVVDDNAYEPFALGVAAAGRLAPCADPLLELERWQPGYGTFFERIAGTLSLAKFGRVHTLCSTDDLGAPVVPTPWPLTPADLAMLRDAVRFDVSRPWDPIHLPPPGRPAQNGAPAPYVPSSCHLGSN